MESLSKIDASQRLLRLSSKRCPHCDGSVSLDSPHVNIDHVGIRVFCSRDCLQDAQSGVVRALSQEAPSSYDPPRRIASARRSLFVFGFGIATISPCGAHRALRLPDVPALATADPSTANVLATPSPSYGPQVATADERAEEFARSLGANGWVHPLPGPRRRMPIRESRAFGADRPGERPYECRSGHCGVDIGGSLWGEQIFSSAEGVVVKVNRSPSRSGGLYLRLAHNDGTVFTQYFHLAAIPKRLKEGVRVRAGEIIGLLGETGIDHSDPHLHFTVSVKASADAPEVYIDPEPLIALWPMRSAEEALVPSPPVLHAQAPGVPIGAKGRYSSRKAGKVTQSAPEEVASAPSAPL